MWGVVEQTRDEPFLSCAPCQDKFIYKLPITTMMQQRHTLIDGYKIRYLVSDNSHDSLLLLHGLGASADRWAFASPILKGHFNLIIPDIIGFGYSAKPNVDYTMDLFSNFVLDFLDNLKVTRTHILGSSMGGQIALEFAAHCDSRVNKLILVSPSGTMTTSTAALDAYTMAALYPGMDIARNAFETMDTSSMQIPESIVRDFVNRMRLPNAKMAYMSSLLGLKNTTNFEDKLRKVTAPTLLIWGSRDVVIPDIYSEPFRTNIGDCTYQLMSGSGHTPYVDNPSGFCKHVINFLHR